LRINNPNLRIDPAITDERGYTTDIGIRGRKKNHFTYELTLFHIHYKGKIGQVLRTDPVLFNDFRLRTNIADARNIGVEAFCQWSILNSISKRDHKWQWIVFQNTAIIDARYIRTEDNSIRDKKVEMVPPYNIKLGNTFKFNTWSTTVQYSVIGEHFSDASNSIVTATAIEGLIPAYSILDFSIQYTRKRYLLEGSVNNIMNRAYFTRRADGYPGPGIIPADGRGFYITLQVKI
jgi:Fe(3+) dicitrate transport protein